MKRKPTVFIDGSAGTTGLRIKERLSARSDIELILLPDELRKDNKAKKEAAIAADIIFLCLPDSAAVESAELYADCEAVIIDTSTAHRTASGWVYGFPELTGKRGEIKASKRIANPGCHASGFIALVAPLVSAGIIKKTAALTCFSVTGYSGGGKKMIAEYEDSGRSPLLSAPRQYGTGQEHKHLKEMTVISGLSCSPIFCPVVSDYYSGMEVTVPLFAKDIDGTADGIRKAFGEFYRSGLVRFEENPGEGGFLSSGALAGRDDMEISVLGSDDRILLVSRFDNLGKGASGAAIQNMNISLGIDEATGLEI